MFSFIVCTLTESNEPQLVRQVQPWWILLSACNVVRQQSLSLGGSREKCGDTFRELPKCPWARRRTLKWSAFEGSRISVPYGHVFIVWSHICVVCNKHHRPWVLLYFFKILPFIYPEKKTTMFSANIKSELFGLPTVPVTPSSQGYFFSTVSWPEGKKRLSCKLY